MRQKAPAYPTHLSAGILRALDHGQQNWQYLDIGPTIVYDDNHGNAIVFERAHIVGNRLGATFKLLGDLGGQSSYRSSIVQGKERLPAQIRVERVEIETDFPPSDDAKSLTIIVETADPAVSGTIEIPMALLHEAAEEINERRSARSEPDQ